MSLPGIRIGPNDCLVAYLCLLGVNVRDIFLDIDHDKAAPGQLSQAQTNSIREFAQYLHLFCGESPEKTPAINRRYEGLRFVSRVLKSCGETPGERKRYALKIAQDLEGVMSGKTRRDRLARTEKFIDLWERTAISTHGHSDSLSYPPQAYGRLATA